MKKHTFVICAYKESLYLEECIKSLIKQKEYSNIILATSTPNKYIADLCKKYNIQEYVNDGEKGITQDWMFAVKCAETPLITIAHQDDVYFEDYSRTVIEYYEKAAKPLIIFSDYWEIRNGVYIRNNTLLKVKRIMLYPLRSRVLQSSRWVRRRILSLGSPICCPSVVYVPGNLPSPLFRNHFKTNEDWEAWEMYSKCKGEFVYISKPLMAHRIHEESETSNMLRHEDGRSQEDYEMFRKFWPAPIANYLVKKYKISEMSNEL